MLSYLVDPTAATSYTITINKNEMTTSRSILKSKKIRTTATTTVVVTTAELREITLPNSMFDTPIANFFVFPEISPQAQ